jgi:alpha-D-xyloside xylohydrolase
MRLWWMAIAFATAGMCVAQSVPPAAPVPSVPTANGSDVSADEASRASLRAPEAAVAGLVRADKGTIAVTLGEGVAAKKLLLYDFEFDGATVSTDKLHLKQISPGVFEISSVAYTVGEWRVRIRDSGNYYGLGARSDTLNHAHTIVRSIMQDAAGAQGSSTGKPVPFFMSTTGYGLWFDTTGQATFDMNASSDADIILDADAEKLRVVMFVGPEMPKLLDRFTALSGRATLPPYWAFAPWIDAPTIDAGEDDTKAVEDADKVRALGLPASVVVVQGPLEAAAKHLHDAGYKVVVPQRLGIVGPGKDASAAETAQYEEAVAQGFFVKSADGSKYSDASGRSYVDFTAAHADLWGKERVRGAIHAGADGFVQQDAAAIFPGDAKFTDGSDARMMRNRYAGLAARSTGAVIEKEIKGNGALLMQDATAGANALGLIESEHELGFSAEDGLPTAVTAGISAGLSGLPLWVAKARPLKSASSADAKAFMRWSEFAAFSPVMSTGRPWEYGDEALAVYRRYASLHTSLLPYRYAAAQEAMKSGIPIMRALMLAYPDDEQARLARNEYLFGPDLLVAPVVDEGMQRVVYLPRGDWVDYWTGAQVSGGKTIVVDAAMDKLPLYAKLGAVLPKLPDDVMTLVPATESGNKTVKTMGDTRVYELTGPAAADVTTTDFEGRRVVRSGNTLAISGDAARVIVRWRFEKVQAATVDGKAVKIESEANGSFVQFDFAGQSTVAWH